jgi:hypothetical protein
MPTKPTNSPQDINRSPQTAGKGTAGRTGSGMGANNDENLRQGQHKVSDHDRDNGGQGRPSGSGANKNQNGAGHGGKKG